MDGGLSARNLRNTFRHRQNDANHEKTSNTRTAFAEWVACSPPSPPASGQHSGEHLSVGRFEHSSNPPCLIRLQRIGKDRPEV